MLNKVVIIFPILVSLMAAHASADVTFNVSRSHIQCVIDNVENYLALNRSTIFITLPDCPDIPEVPVTLIAIVANEGVKYSEASEANLDLFVFLTKPQLECLSELTLPPGVAEFLFVPSSCELRPLE